MAVAVALLVGATAVAGCGGGGGSQPSIAVVSDDTEADFEFVVPRGTSDYVRLGQPVTIIPNPLIMRVGDVIRIENQDTIGYNVGPFYVGPNQTMTQIATSPGSFKGMCLLHTGEELQVTIQKA